MAFILKKIKNIKMKPLINENKTYFLLLNKQIKTYGIR